MNDITEKYTIKECIHRSSRADIYLGSIEGIGNFRRTIILKRYKQLSHIAFQTLSQDAKQASVLNHANIVQVLDLGQWEGDWTVIMEHIPGVLLSDFIQTTFAKKNSVPDTIIFHVILEILKGLEYAHRRLVQDNLPALLHLNLQPDEVFLDSHGNIKIKGFSTVSKIEKSSRFHPPEEIVDHRSDIWGVGALIQAMLVGLEKVDPLETLTSAPRNALERIATQATHPNVDKRFQSIAAMKEALITQCGGIDLQGARKLADFMKPYFSLPGQERIDPDFDDLPTYVSKTISKRELELLRQGALNTSPQQGAPPPAAQPQPIAAPATTSRSITIPILSFVFGLVLASSLWLLVPSFQSSSIIFYFPKGVQIDISDQSITQSGIKYNFPAEQPMTAKVNMPNGVVQELKIQLKTGETRLIMIENLDLQ